MDKHGDEHIVFGGAPTGFRLSDFWSWSASDLLDNTLRGIYSEFIVAAALGLDLSKGRENWLPWDLALPCKWRDSGGNTHGSIRLEVKSAAYLQSWNEGRLSRITFNIRQTRAWDAKQGGYGAYRRQSDVYVFCVYAEKDRQKADPLLLDKWEFYILPTRALDERCGAQKSLSLGALLRLDPVRAGYPGIKDAVMGCVRGGSDAPL